MTVMAKSRQRITSEELWLAQELAGGTECQSDPVAFDAPSRWSQEAEDEAVSAARHCRMCPALFECSAYAKAHPEVRGVIAGLIRLPSRIGRPAKA